MHKDVSDEAVTSLHDLSAVDLLAGYRAKQFSPSEVMEEVLAHVEAWEPQLKALYAFDPDGARAAAKASTDRWYHGEKTSVLDGVPVTIKDNIATKGQPVPLGAASVTLVPASADAPPAARLREAGGAALGASESSHGGKGGAHAADVISCIDECTHSPDHGGLVGHRCRVGRGAGAAWCHAAFVGPRRGTAGGGG